MYEIQHFTLCDDWVNCWTTYDDQGNEYPTVFNSHDEAQQALSEYLSESEYEYQIGNIDTRYHASEYRIVQIEEITA